MDLKTVNVLPRGLECDRRWMIVDSNNQFLSQRNTTQLAQLKVTAAVNGLSLSFNGQVHNTALPDGARIDVAVWASTVSALIADDRINKALSDWLGKAVSLVYMDAAAKRATSDTWAPGHETSFSDGYPILVVNSATLNAVNDYIIKAGFNPVSMARFRPNIVIETDQPYAEDDWESLSIGDVQLDLIKPCTRCLVTTLDPMTGAAQPEPVIEALKALRMSTDPRNKGVLFGVNAVVKHAGQIEVGQSLRSVR